MSTSDSTLHCFQIVNPMASSWVDADETCQEYGGHIAHPEAVGDLSALKDYIESVSSFFFLILETFALDHLRPSLDWNRRCER